jgi:hypothetical protein
MHSPKSLHNLQHDEGGNYMAETENGKKKRLMIYHDFLDRGLLLTRKLLNQVFLASKLKSLITSKSTMT